MMNWIKYKLLCFLVAALFLSHAHGQKADTAGKGNEYAPHNYFIITAGTDISAFFKDKPIQVSTVEDFNSYVQSNIKTLKDSWVVVTGKPKSGTFDEVMKTLKRNKFKHISTNIKDL
jgi:hypothetical protein